MRYTVVHRDGVVSFVADCDALAALVAACAHDPRDLRQFLLAADHYDKRLHEYVSSGLSIFDEHNSTTDLGAIHGALDYYPPHELPVFRVLDERTRQASLAPVKAGVILFNLNSRRIVQLMNSYAEIQRKGRVRVHDGAQLTNEIRRYELPGDWRLVPG